MEPYFGGIFVDGSIAEWYLASLLMAATALSVRCDLTLLSQSNRNFERMVLIWSSTKILSLHAHLPTKRVKTLKLVLHGTIREINLKIFLSENTGLIGWSNGP